MAFSYETNRIINGTCEWCGIPAVNCEHYKEKSTLPLDEAERLKLPGYLPPKQATMPIEPLTEKEKAGSVEEAKARMEEMTEEKISTDVEKTDQVAPEAEI